ncbi:hypothetical protein [Sphingomonas aracearum]|uniref:Phage shock protein B n=1 Tax=Sphingomonas aracearum TaxID=2283317 RepID=A0A369VS55_9SPHN|nr:hypothetical protein [Sphingomonas aracearum]RDE05218.1 hypothetical protein DVW87_08060 [Sphingomonas aracearum]
MNPFEMVVLIVLIVTVGAVLKTRANAARHREAAIEPTDVEQENRELRRELRAMQERLAVLERLATDNNDSSARLDREIERLRDKH